jgi:hypothetical protein
MDLFAHYTMNFDALYSESIVLSLTNTTVRVASIEHLIAIKRAPTSFGGWSDAEELRKWSFFRRTPQQRLDWLVDALTISLQVRSTPPAPHDAATDRTGGEPT